MDPFCNGLHQFGSRFAAFCINLGPVLLRSASIWAHVAAFCINWGPFCCVLHQFQFGSRFAAFCINLVLIL